jgi:ABC-2 type transport system ATP-binding protein
MNPAVALELEHLSKRYGRTQAVADLSLQVCTGEMVGFLGPNGAGKSTTLYMITGLVRPSSGTMAIFGHDVRRDFVRAMSHVGAMVETPAFHGSLSARTNLEMIARVRGLTDPQAIAAVLEQVGLSQRQRDPVVAYSQGMKQRLGLAAALLGSPRLLLLDEPTNGLDPEAMQDVLHLIRTRVREDGLAVLISSHLLAEVEEYCDRVIIMNGGRLIQEGNVRELLAPHEDHLLVTFAGEPPALPDLAALEGVAGVEEQNGVYAIRLQGRDGAWLAQTLVNRGWRLASLRPRRRTLREFFFQSTGGADR